MKPQRLTIVLALLMALVGTGGLLAYVHGANARAVAGMKAAYTLVAKQAIPAGTSAASAVQQGLLTSQELPASSVPDDAVRSLTAGLGTLVVSSEVQPGELLLRDALVPKAQAASSGQLALPAGLQAVTIPFCLPAAVAGYLVPGSEVAVYDTVGGANATVAQNCTGSTNSQANINAVSTRVVVPKLEVLSVAAAGNQQSSSGITTSNGRSPTTGGSDVSGTGAVLVTLAVNQSDCQRLITLSEAGVPYLSLLTPTSPTGFSPPPVLFQS